MMKGNDVALGILVALAAIAVGVYMVSASGDDWSVVWKWLGLNREGN